VHPSHNVKLRFRPSRWRRFSASTFTESTTVQRLRTTQRSYRRASTPLSLRRPEAVAASTHQNSDVTGTIRRAKLRLGISEPTPRVLRYSSLSFKGLVFGLKSVIVSRQNP